MGIALTRTKILLPRRPNNLLTRKRLLDLLYDVLDYRLFIISAPAGYGKTSLLVDLAQQIELPVCWYALDELDQDPRQFFAYFIAALTQRFPDFGERASGMLENTTAPIDINRLVQVIVNDAYDHISEHFLMVLDDYHLVNDNETINQFIDQFIQSVDENCHLVLLSRSLLSLNNLPLMVARSQVAGIGFEELAFRPEEIQALMRQNYQFAMPQTVAEDLVHETEGWITGLLLSAHTMWQGMADRVRLARVSGIGLYDYMAQQVLNQQSPPIRDFLLWTSLLEEFDVQLCNQVLGDAVDWQQMINAVQQNNLFVLPVESDRTWLRYHHLFRDFLQAQIAQEQPETQKQILQRLAAVYAEQKAWEKAYQIYQRLGDAVAMADLIEQSGSSMIKDGRWTTLAQWLDSLPADLQASRPSLISLRGYVAVGLGKVEQGLTLMNQAEQAFEVTTNTRVVATNLVRRATAHRFRGDYQASLDDADQALSLSNGNHDLQDVRAEALRVKGLSNYWIGQLDQAITWLEKSLNTYTRVNDHQMTPLLHMELGLALMNTGRYEQALVHYNHALEKWGKANNMTRKAALMNNMGVLYYLKGEYEQASAALEQALRYAKQSGYTRMEALTLLSMGDLYIDIDAFSAADAAYHQALQIAQQTNDRFLLIYSYVSQAILAQQNDNPSEAQLILKKTDDLVKHSDSSYECGLWHMGVGRVALGTDDASTAINHLENAVACFKEKEQPIEFACAQLSLTAAHQIAGHETQVVDQLKQLRTFMETLETHHPIVVAGRELKPQLQAIQDNLGVRGWLTQLLDQVDDWQHKIPALRRTLRQQTSTSSFTPPQLIIQALGDSVVKVNGKVVTTADWQAQVARDLIFFLLAHPDGLSRGAIESIFWPDKSPSQLKVHFKKTMYRLRRALGADVVLYERERYQFNRNLDYEYDVETFQRHLQQASSATDVLDRLAAYKAAIATYKGPYLPYVDGTWVETEREQLWQGYSSAMLALAEHHLNAAEYEQTMDYGQRLLRDDPYLEEAHRLIMLAYAGVGDLAAVTRQFERCRQGMLEDLNIPPSDQTQELYQQLTSSDTARV